MVEPHGKIQFGLPGKPMFDALDPQSFLKPTLLWRLWADSIHESEPAGTAKKSQLINESRSALPKLYCAILWLVLCSYIAIPERPQ